MGGRKKREREGGRREKKAKGQRNKEAVRIRVGSKPPRPRPDPAPSPAQRGVVLVSTPATLVALQTLVTARESVTAPTPRLRVHTAGRRV